MLPSPAQTILVSGPVGNYDHIFVFPRLSPVLKWGLLFDNRRGLTTTGHSLSTGVTRAGSHTMTGPFFHTHARTPEELIAYFLSLFLSLVALGFD
jgi:hypothetical protein